MVERVILSKPNNVKLMTILPEYKSANEKIFIGVELCFSNNAITLEQAETTMTMF